MSLKFYPRESFSREQLEQLMRDHDWFYDYSDDLRAHGRGYQQRSLILDHLAFYSGAEAEELIQKYSPPEEIQRLRIQLGRTRDNLRDVIAAKGSA